MPYIPTEYGWAEYHSLLWERMVEAGWMTQRVETLPDGTKMARMIRQPRGRW